MKYATLIFLCSSVLVAACQTTTGSQAPVPYESTTRIAPSGVSEFMFRTHTKVGEDKTEIEGVPCTMVGEGFRSVFATPAKLSAPVFGTETRLVTITCRHEDQAKSKTLSPFNKTQADANKSLITLKGATSVTGAVIAAAKIGTAMRPRDKTQDVYAYRNSAMTFVLTEE